MSTLAPEWDQYPEEYLVYPRAGGYKRKPEQTAYIVCYRSHWQDFIRDGIAKLIDEYDIDGVPGRDLGAVGVQESGPWLWQREAGWVGGNNVSDLRHPPDDAANLHNREKT
ncbi:MAG: hypothetical protein H5U08_07150 [Thermogutta sp.]|uniref:hypothetical protein n=1 Tax=Thermogutta sp. TaxID=1962930 RepID=UPI0019A63560|nr:hypothetical protein [Thermogutta sp.]MBC7352119.1 hypothetical protein [Thermogutta sp.]